MTQKTTRAVTRPHREPRSARGARSASLKTQAKELFRSGILVAAEQEFAARGFHAARIGDIAVRAGTAVGTVYNHFAQKEDLLRALLDERIEGMLAALAPHPDDPDSFEGRLTLRMVRLLGYIEQHRAFFSIVHDMGGLGAEPMRESAREAAGQSVRRLDRLKSAFQAIAIEGINSGALEPLDPADLGAFLGASMKTFVMSLDRRELPLVDKAPLIARLFLRGAGRSSR
jgi:AcrR family transcriptional regulator